LEVALPSLPSGQITALLARWKCGDASARESLVPLVYQELRRRARLCLKGQRQHATVQSTSLVHEAYLRLVDQNAVGWEDRSHFFAAASQIMRRLLVDQLRRRTAQKRGGGGLTLALDEAVALPRTREVDLVALDDALTQLARVDPQQARIVELRFFGGLSIEEASHALGISPATVKRDWATARAWLYREVRARRL
jgi:RNA polymerase sigma factor (TIGR02999 family)